MMGPFMQKNKIINGAKKYFVFAVVFSIIETICISFYPFILSYIVDNYNSLSIRKIVIIILFFLASIVLLLFFSYFKKIMVSRYKQVICFNIRKETFKEILCLDYNEFYKKNYDYYVSYFVNDIELIYEKHYENIIYLVLHIVSTIAYFIVLAFVSYLMMVVTVVTSLIVLFIPNLVGEKFDKKQGVYSENRGAYLSRTNEILDGYDLVDRRNVSLLLDIYNKSLNNLQVSEYKLNKYYAFVEIFSGSTLYIQLLLVFSLGLIFLFNNLITIGNFSSSLVFVDYIAMTVCTFASTILDIKSVDSYKEKMYEILDKNNTFKFNDESPSNDTFISLKAENVSFTIFKKHILKNISFDVLKNNKILITGKNGSGKSTFGKILCGLINDYEGKILINDKYLNRNLYISYMPQRRFVYEGSILENIVFFKKNISQEEIKNINNILKMLNFKLSLDFEIKRNGSNLSGGEIAKICFAREIIRAKDVLIIDEPFNDLDEKTINDITIFLENMDKTIILISHIKLDKKIITFNKEYLLKNGELKLVK